jgi:transcriptional regulator with XRE-family HTH domain
MGLIAGFHHQCRFYWGIIHQNCRFYDVCEINHHDFLCNHVLLALMHQPPYTESERREDMLNLIAIGDRISERRKELNMTQDDLAMKLNVTRQAISKYELGKNMPSIDILIDLTKVLGLSIDQLLEGVDLDDHAYEDQLIQYPRASVIHAFLNSDHPSAEFKNVFFRLHPEERRQMIERVVSGTLTVDIRQVWPYLSASERMYVLGTIKSKKTTIDVFELNGMLSPEEMMLVYGHTQMAGSFRKKKQRKGEGL